MRKLIRNLWNDDRGNTLIIAGMALPLLVGSAGLATDTIHWTLWKRELQRAADSAAIAGVYERLETKATDTVGGVVDHDLELNHHTGDIAGVAIGLEATYPIVTFPADDGDKENQVKVELAVRKVLPFSSLFMSEAPLIRAEIWQCLTELKAAGQSILVIDKNVAALIRIADRHYMIERGRVVWSGNSAELAAAPAIQHRYLGV